jgi:hypothetical protein
MVYTYSAYELIWQSEIPLPELVPLEKEKKLNQRGQLPPMVNIRLGAVPQNLDSPICQGVLYEAKKNQFLLKLEDIASYWVQNGDEIIIAPHPEVTADEVRLFLLGSCLGALLHQRGILAMHASSIEVNQGAVLFMGDSGNGKSTLLGALLQRGYPMLADDVTGIVIDDEKQPLVLPAFPQVKLWHDACQQLEQPISNLRAVRSDLEKYAVPMHQQFVTKSLPLKAVYVLATHNQADITLEPLDDSAKFQAFLDNTYRQGFLDGLAMRLPHFQLATLAAKAARVTRVTRPSHQFLLDELADRILEDLR